MSEKLKLSDVRIKLPFTINRGLSVFRIKDVFDDDNYNLDFDVFLPSIGKNLQRELCWTLHQKQELIMSILKGIQIPKMAFVHVDHKVIQVIDGKQRLSAWIDFVNGNFSISFQGNDYFFSDLDKDSQMELTYSYVTADVAYEYTEKNYEQLIPDEWKIEWFRLINFAGTPQDKDHLNNLLEQK